MYVGWKVCLSEQIHVCDNIQFEVSVKYNVHGTSSVKTTVIVWFSHQIAAKQSHVNQEADA